MAYSPEDLDYLVRTIHGEIGNRDGALGQQAVAAVILNRLNATPGASIRDIVLAQNQFEPWNNKATRERMMAVARGSDGYNQTLANIQPVIDGKLDPTNGATHFYSPTAQQSLGRSKPSWDNGSGVDIGAHRFFKLGGNFAPGIGQGTGGQTAQNPNDGSSTGGLNLSGLFNGAAPVGSALGSGVKQASNFAQQQISNVENQNQRMMQMAAQAGAGTQAVRGQPNQTLAALIQKNLASVAPIGGLFAPQQQNQQVQNQNKPPMIGGLWA